MFAVQQQLEADRVAKEQQAWSDRFVACLGGNVLVGKRAGGARYRCESMFSQAIASVSEGTFGEQELVLGIVGAYHARVDTGKHGGKADGAISGVILIGFFG